MHNGGEGNTQGPPWAIGGDLSPWAGRPPLGQGENFEKLWEVQFLGFTGIFSKMLVFKTCANVPCYLGGPHSV